MADVKGEPMSITVKAQDGNEVQFRIKKSTVMGKVMQAYCDKKGMDIKTLKFVFDGVRVTSEVTAEALGIEDDDSIDVFIEQLGG